MHCLLRKTLVSFAHIHPKPKAAAFSHRSLTTRSMSSASTAQRLFQLKVDPLTGNSEWVVIEEQEAPEEDFPNKPLLATTSYLDMLNDSPRNRAFSEAIKKTVTKPCHVLDIGYSLHFNHTQVNMF